MNKQNRSELTFIAYKGNDINYSQITDALTKICPPDYHVKYITDNDLTMAQIVDADAQNKGPHKNNKNATFIVNGYNPDELKQLEDDFTIYDIEDESDFNELTIKMYENIKTKIFKALEDQIHFCAVIWDNKTNSFIAGITEANNQYTQLYYGYTKQNHKLIFSNNKEILQQFCNEVFKMENGTYIKNGEIYTLNGKEKNPILFKKSKTNMELYLESLNSLLAQITDEAIRAKIEQSINEYFSSQNSKETINNLIIKELNTEAKKQMLEVIKRTIQEYTKENNIAEQLRRLLDEKLTEYANRIQIPITHIIKLNDTLKGQTPPGFYHEKFEQILSQVQLDEPIMLIGPAGSGKNVTISQVASALGQNMYYTNNVTNEFKLTGFIDAGGNYRDTEFYKAFKNGGLFFLDELDGSDPSALIVINSALANGYMAFPHETIDRHPDFRIIAAANTWGTGANLQYIGRNILDGATLDRFDTIYFDYDEKLEQTLYPCDEVLEFMWAFRKAVFKARIPHIVSTRGIGKVYKKEINQIPVQVTLESNVTKNLNQDDINIIIGNMENVNENNKYFNGLQRLRRKK